MSTARYNIYDCTTVMPSRDWAGFLSSHFRRLDCIKKYHHFCFEQDHPGVVFLKKTATAEEETRCLLLGDWSPSEIHVPSTKSVLLSTLKRWTFASVRIPLSFLNLMSSYRCTLHCILRRGCKAVGPGSMTLTIVICSQIFVP